MKQSWVVLNSTYDRFILYENLSFKN